MTTIEQVDALHQIAEYMQDDSLAEALTTIAKLILKPDIPPQTAAIELVRLQAISARCSMLATWMANVDKSNRAKKNLYYTAAEAINNLVAALKYTVR